MHFFEPKTWQQTISKTGFFVSFFSYGIFFLVDLLRSGFVARFFSVHLFLIATIFFGIWWAMVLNKEKDRVIWQYIMMIFLGSILAIFTWKLGQGFAEMRLLITFLAIFIPLIILQIIRVQ